MNILTMMLSVALVALAGAVPAATAQAPFGNVYAADGLVLPRDHVYERYDSKNDTYTRVDVERVPQLVRRNVAVYDRTDGVWVYGPQHGVNPRYATAGAGARAGRERGRGNWDRQSDAWDERGGWARVNGTVTAVRDNRLTVREDSGREVVVNMSQARTRQRDGLRVGDRVSVVGIPTGPDRLNARAVRERGAGARAGHGQQDDGWQHIHGRVQSVEGTTMRFRADDGRALTVDLSPVGEEIRRALAPGEGATVIGYDWTGPNRIRAEYVQQDSSDPSRGGAIAPSASSRSRR